MIQKSLQDPLADLILAGDVSDGETVTVTAANGRLALNGREVEQAA